MTVSFSLIVRTVTVLLTLEETIEMILKHSSEYDRKDIMQMIEEKRQELGPEVVNEESAAMIVARELGIDLQQVSPKGRVKISDITEEKINKTIALTAKIVNIGTVRTFSRKDGGEGKVASIILADDSGQIRVALWDEKTQIVSEDSEESVAVGNIVQIRGAYVKVGFRDALELNLGRMGHIRILSDYELDDVDFEVSSPESQKISDLEEKMYDVTLTVKVQRVFSMSTFSKKDGSEGKVLSMIVADETGSTRFVCWDSFAEEMQDVEEDEVIGISGAYTRAGRRDGDSLEVHSGRSAKIERRLKQKIEAVGVSGSAPAEALGRKSIADLELGMHDVDVDVKVIQFYPPKQFDKKDGSTGQVQNVIATDVSGQTIRIAFWDEDVEKIKDLAEGDIIRILHGYVKKGFRDDIEYGIGRRSEIKINPKDASKKLAKVDISNLSLSPPTRAGVGRIRIGEIDENMVDDNVEVCGIIVGVGQTKPVYPACPECRKKLNVSDGNYSCLEHGDVSKPDYRMLFKITVDDGSGSIRTTLFGEAGEALLQMTAEEAQKLIEESNNDQAPIEHNSDKMLGSYIVVKGRVNKYKDSLDIGASSLSFADPVEEIKRMKESIDEFI